MLSIAPSTRGFGFAVMMTESKLVDWGVKSVTSGRKNEHSLARAVELIDLYAPETIVLEDCSTGSRKRPRVQALIEEIASHAIAHDINVERLSRRQVNLEILQSEGGTKHAIAKKLSHNHEKQLGFRLPRKRRPWESEPHQMDMFNAVALVRSFLGLQSNAKRGRQDR